MIEVTLHQFIKLDFFIFFTSIFSYNFFIFNCIDELLEHFKQYVSQKATLCRPKSLIKATDVLFKHNGNCA